MDIQVHSLVLLNISDHYTRHRANRNQMAVVGFLLGTQEGRKLQIWNNFEVPFKQGGLDTEFAGERIEQYKEVFPELDILGWYRVGMQVDYNIDQLIRVQLELYNENPIFLLVHESIQDPE